MSEDLEPEPGSEHRSGTALVQSPRRRRKPRPRAGRNPTVAALVADKAQVSERFYYYVKKVQREAPDLFAWIKAWSNHVATARPRSAFACAMVGPGTRKLPGGGRCPQRGRHARRRCAGARPEVDGAPRGAGEYHRLTARP